MKSLNFSTLALAAAMTANAFAFSGATTNEAGNPADITARHNMMRQKHRLTPEASQWHYDRFDGYNLIDGEWVNTGYQNFEYYPSGVMRIYEGFSEVNGYKDYYIRNYDEEGNLISREATTQQYNPESKEYENLYHGISTYNPEITSLIPSEMTSYQWIENEKVKYLVQALKPTYSGDKLVKLECNRTLSEGKECDINLYTITYGYNEAGELYQVEFIDNDFYNDGRNAKKYLYRNITWKNPEDVKPGDMAAVLANNTSYNDWIEDYSLYFKSLTYEMSWINQPSLRNEVLNVIVDYADDDFSYEINVKCTHTEWGTIYTNKWTREKTDEYGSFTRSTVIYSNYWGGEPDDEVITTAEQSVSEKYICDDQYEIVKVELYYDGVLSYYSNYIQEYNPEFGYVENYIYESWLINAEGEPELQYTSKGIYSGYNRYTNAVEQIGFDTDIDATPEYYTLQGIRMNPENLPSGLYLKKTGSKVTKILK